MPAVLNILRLLGKDDNDSFLGEILKDEYNMWQKL